MWVKALLKIVEGHTNKKKKEEEKMTSVVNELMTGWLTEISDSLRTRDMARRRHHKKQMRGNNQVRAVRPATDVTFSRDQGFNTGTGADSLLSTVVNKSQCYQPAQAVGGRVREIVENSLRDEASDATRGQMFEAFLGSRRALKAFLEEHKQDLREGVRPDAIESEQLSFLWESLLPKALRENMLAVGSGVEEKKWNALSQILDSKLVETLVGLARPNQRDTVRLRARNFALQRRSGFLGAIPETLLREMGLPRDSFNMIPDSQRCNLLLLYQLRKTLQKKGDRRAIAIPPALNRVVSDTPGPYNALSRPERADAHLRIAKRMFVEGLSRMTKAYSASGASAASFAQRGLHRSGLRNGFRKIYNLVSSDGGRQCSAYEKPGGVRVEDEKTCDTFAQDKRCAASCALMAFMEVSDTHFSPHPPLIKRVDMKRITAPYVTPAGELEAFGPVTGYRTWPRHKRDEYTRLWNDYLRRYEAVGFVRNGQDPSTGLPTLNIDAWGLPDQTVVPNPFRVREDTTLNRLLGGKRFDLNRLGIGDDATKRWAGHYIRDDYDPEFCRRVDKALSKREKRILIKDVDGRKFYPRPIVNPNGDARLYEAVPAEVTSIRKHVEGDSVYRLMKRLVQDREERKEGSDERLFRGLNPVQTTATSAFRCLENIYKNFRTATFPNLKMAYDVKAVRTELRTRPRQGPGEGKGFRTGIVKVRPTDREPSGVDPPPRLFNLLRDPKTDCVLEYTQFVKRERDSDRDCGDVRGQYEAGGDRVRVIQECLNLPNWATAVLNDQKEELEQDEYFPYPLASRKGELQEGTTVLPLGFNRNMEPPYERKEGATMYSAFPDANRGYWDLRTSLSFLLTGESESKKLEDLKRSHRSFEERKRGGRRSVRGRREERKAPMTPPQEPEEESSSPSPPSALDATNLNLDLGDFELPENEEFKEELKKILARASSNPSMSAGRSTQPRPNPMGDTRALDNPPEEVKRMPENSLSRQPSPLSASDSDRIMWKEGASNANAGDPLERDTT